MQVNATDALIVVDVQKDFCPGGALAVAEGHAIVPTINALQRLFSCVVFTRDWHPGDHCSFSGAPEFVDGSWPVHCVADSDGAAFHSKLNVASDARIVSKGTDARREAYSGFQGTGLEEMLRTLDVTRVFVCGLATDYCVKATSLDAQRAGFDVVVIADACRAVDVPAGSGDRAFADMAAAGVAQCDSGDIA